jgi:hypothetical protein
METRPFVGNFDAARCRREDRAMRSKVRDMTLEEFLATYPRIAGGQDPAPPNPTPPPTPVPPPAPTPPAPQPPEPLREEGLRALRAERERAETAERRARDAEAEATRLRQEQESEQDRLRREAQEGRDARSEGIRLAREAHTLNALAGQGVVGPKAQAALRLLEGVQYDEHNHTPTNLGDRIEAAKALYGAEVFGGATPPPAPVPPAPGVPPVIPPVVDLHQGPRAPANGPTDDELADSYGRAHFAEMMPPAPPQPVP